MENGYKLSWKVVENAHKRSSHKPTCIVLCAEQPVLIALAVVTHCQVHAAVWVDSACWLVK